MNLAFAGYVVLISCVILVGLFSLQHHGTNKVAFMFAPIVTAWLICISGIGIYNIFRWNPSIVRALSPSYMYRFLRSTGIEGWVSLGGVVLCITGNGYNDPMILKKLHTFLVDVYFFLSWFFYKSNLPKKLSYSFFLVLFLRSWDYVCWSGSLLCFLN